MTDLWGWSVAIIPWLQRITVEHVWIPIGSMVLVYMLTWLGYIDGIHVTIYSIHGSYGIWTIDHWFGSTAKKALCCWWKIIMFNDVTKGWIVKSPYYDILVGGFNHLEKYESQWEGLTHIIWKIKMFQTTNQYIIYIYLIVITLVSESFSLGITTIPPWAPNSINDRFQKGVLTRNDLESNSTGPGQWSTERWATMELVNYSW